MAEEAAINSRKIRTIAALAFAGMLVGAAAGFGFGRLLKHGLPGDVHLEWSDVGALAISMWMLVSGLFIVIAAATVLYLGYLRRQTRIEERVQRRRMQRMARSQLGVENTYDREYDVVPSRLRRPGAVVLEIDDEDPIFEHLEYAPYAREYSWQRDLPRAAGQ